jgi:hypothetical protein
MNSTKINNLNRKILALEYYFIFQNNGIKSVAMDLGIAYGTLLRIINDYKKNDGFIIKSKL